jgi:hypothetical protein
MKHRVLIVGTPVTENIGTFNLDTEVFETIKVASAFEAFGCLANNYFLKNQATHTSKQIDCLILSENIFDLPISSFVRTIRESKYWNKIPICLLQSKPLFLSKVHQLNISCIPMSASNYKKINSILLDAINWNNTKKKGAIIYLDKVAENINETKLSISRNPELFKTRKEDSSSHEMNTLMCQIASAIKKGDLTFSLSYAQDLAATARICNLIEISRVSLDLCGTIVSRDSKQSKECFLKLERLLSELNQERRAPLLKAVS